MTPNLRTIATGILIAAASAHLPAADGPTLQKDPPTEQSPLNERHREKYKRDSVNERGEDAKASREKNGNLREERGKRRDPRLLTAEERTAKRREFQERLEKRLAELRHKQTNGTLSSEEMQELDRRLQILRRFQSATRENPATPPPPTQ